MSYKGNEGMGTITIKLHYCSREERDELINFLNDKQWDIEEISGFKDTEDGDT
jgi:hypothetical protein